MDSAAFIGALHEGGVTHVVGLPDLETASVFEQLARQPGALPSAPHVSPRLVLVCREGEALALAAGLWAGGCRPLVLIQNTGFFEAGDCLRSMAYELEAPLDLVVGYRGYSGKPNAGRPDTARDYFEPLLAAWGLTGSLLDGRDDYRGFARRLRDRSRRESGFDLYLLPQ